MPIPSLACSPCPRFTKAGSPCCRSIRMCDVPARRPEHAEKRRMTSRTGELMKTDAEIKEDVIRELRWDPQLTEPDAIGVARQDGAGGLDRHHAQHTREA